MVCEEEIYDWFRDSVSSRRIDVLCSLLRLCLPLELRFVGSCLEDLARKDYRSLQEYELRANDESGYAALVNATTTPEELQNTLNIYVSLLHSTNTLCANSLFRILEGLYDKIRLPLAQGLSGSIGREDPAVEDLLLLFTMAAHHPAFTFSQRKRICEVLMNVKQVLKKLGLIKLSQRQPDTATGNSVGNSLHLMASGSPKSCDSNSQLCPIPGTTLRYYVTVLEMRRNNRNQSTEFCLETNWPDGEKVQLWKPYKDLQIFHEELERLFSGISGDKSLSWYLPQFPVKEKNPQNDARMSDAMKTYIREIFSLPFNITGDDRFRHIFQDLFKKRDAAIVSASVSATLSPSLPVGKTQASLSAPTSPHSAFPTSLPPSAKTVISKLPNDSLLNRMVTISTSQVTSASLQSSQSNHLMESSTRCVPSSRSSPLSSRSSAFLPSQDARSRHRSSQGYASVGAWLKEIRLHKYEAQLAKYSWKELFKLTDSDLQKEGFTVGACNKFANEIECLKTRLGSNLESLSVSSNSSRTCILTNPSSSKQSAVPTAMMINKSVPGISYPASIDSSCSDYFTPSGSPEPQQSSISKSQIRTGFGQQTVTTSFTNKENQLDASKSTIISQPSDMMRESDVPAVRSISLEALAQQHYTTEPVGIWPLYVPTGDSVPVNCETYPDESSVSGIIRTVPEMYARAAAFSVHESVSVLRTPDPVADMTRVVIDPMKVPFPPQMSALNPWQISAQEQHMWSASRTANVQPLVPCVGSTEVQAFCSESHSDGSNLAPAHAEEIVVETTSHSTGFNPRLPVLDSPIMSPPFPIPSDAVLVRPRLPIGMPPIVRIPAMVSPASHFSDDTMSNVGAVTDTATKNCSPLGTDRSSNPHFPLQGPPSAVLYPPVAPVSPAFRPQPVLNQIIAGTQNKMGYRTPHAADMPDLSNLSPAVLNPSVFPGEHLSSAESQPVEMVNQPSGLANFVPGFVGLQPPLPSPAGNLPMMHSGMPAVMSPACHSVSQVSFTGNNDPTVGETVCLRCQQYEQFLCMIPYQNMWPAEAMFPRSTCFSVIAPQHVSPQFQPLHGTQLQNGINPDLRYRASCIYSCTGTRPLHTVRPGCAAPFPHYVFHCRSGPTTSLSTCSNCGSLDHSHLECKEQTMESVLGAGCFRLNIPKTEAG